MKHLLSSAIFILLSCVIAEAARTYSTEPDDNEFFQRHRQAISPRWTSPVERKNAISRHAPLGPYIGNGDVGAVAYSTFNSQTLRIGKVDFVTDAWSDWAGDGAASIPVGGVEIEIQSPGSDGFLFQMDQYDAELFMRSATETPVEMTSWISTDRNLIFTKLNSPAGRSVRINVSTFAASGEPVYKKEVSVNDRIARAVRITNSSPSAAWVSKGAISTRILGADPVVSVVNDSTVRSVFTLSPQNPVWVVSCISGGGTSGLDGLGEADSLLRSLSLAAIDTLCREKNEWWRDMWHRSYVDTGDSILNRQYLTSIYLLASACNPHASSGCGMYGPWNLDDNMMYHGDIHLNYNSQAGFYSVFSANRPELSIRYLELIERLVPEGIRRAKSDAGQVHPSLQGRELRGILFPVSALPSATFYGSYWQQTMNAPFNVPLFAWMTDYTADTTYLRDHAYPYIRLCGDFYEDYLQRQDINDTVYVYNVTTGAHEDSWDLNPPSELGLIQSTFSLLLRYSRLLDVDSARRPLWQDILTHMPSYPVTLPTRTPNTGRPIMAKNADGWDLPAHVIQLHPVYPCEVLTLASDSALVELARNTIQYYSVDQRGFTDTMNELGLSAFVMAARVGFDPDTILSRLRTLALGAAPNLLIVDGHHCLEKTTVIETINSMMLQTIDGIMTFFPCWPDRPASFTRLLAKGAFQVSASTDGADVQNVTVTSLAGRPCTVRSPWTCRSIAVIHDDGSRRELPVSNGVVSFPTESDNEYALYPMY